MHKNRAVNNGSESAGNTISKIISRSLPIRAVAISAGLCLMALCLALSSRAQTAPKYKFDPDWPKPLPNKWKLGGVTGLAVDKDDNVWVLDRPNDLRDLELHAMKNPPTADCCARPPSMIHIDKAGNVIGSFTPDQPQGHGMAVDNKGFVCIGQFTVNKYDPKTGKIAGSTPRAPEMPPGGGGGEAGATTPADPSRGGPGPGGTFPAPAGGGGRGGADPAARAAAVAAFRAKYPPTTPMIVQNIEEIRIDEAAHELYATDAYLGGRVMVFDLETLAFKRGWGAYGHALSEITTNDVDRAYTPGGPLPKELRGHVTLNISNDGLVYIADRNANRIQVTTKQGKFLKEFTLAPTTAEGGSTGGVAFSPDKAQRFLFISDLTNNHIWFLNRDDGKVIGQMGSMSQNGGQFFGLHMIAVDSKGNIYTGEVFNGERVQRFVPAR
jgi:DNA-binding beta-propeller fold protein YncE